MKTAVILFSAHVKIESLTNCVKFLEDCTRTIVLTTQYVFENERVIIDTIFKNTEYVCFADLMNDTDGELCDTNAFQKYKDTKDLSLSSMYKYFRDLSILKNQLLVDKIQKIYQPEIKIAVSDDLGIVKNVWLDNGYQDVVCEYIYTKEQTGHSVINKIFQKKLFFKIAKRLNINYPKNIHVAHYNGKKYIFHGHLERAGYRINLNFYESNVETFKHWIVKLMHVIFGIKIRRANTVNLTTLHEYGNYAYYEMMDIPEFNNYLIQDGLLPPNDCCKYLFFYGINSRFLSWDKLGSKLFEYHHLPVDIMPFRNTFPLPLPKFNPIKKVLCVSSGAGDWTAIKNRSDEDKTVVAISHMAEKYPNVDFIYRCHPSWVFPDIQGINSIQRVAEYFDFLHLPNIRVSSNIPSITDTNGNPVVSHKRSSLESDLEDVDLIFGVHSVSMLDGAMKCIPFASINLSGRRNLFEGITELGFPHCESEADIIAVFENINKQSFQLAYNKAIEKYNNITEEI